MRMTFPKLALPAALAVTLLAAPAAFAKGKPAATVVSLKTSAGADAGTATFSETKKGLKVVLNLKGLPMGDHAVHIHVKPVCDAPDFKGAGGHFNPATKQHGLQNPMGHHAGDLPQNVTANGGGIATATFTVDYLSIGTGTATDILANGGTAIMVHEKADDMKTDPTGNAGNRIACGVIAPAM